MSKLFEDVSKAINDTIDEKINPLLNLHKGSCEAVSLEEGILTIRLNGGCVGCPSAKLTLLNLILPILQENHPNTVKDVVLDV